MRKAVLSVVIGIAAGFAAAVLTNPGLAQAQGISSGAGCPGAGVSCSAGSFSSSVTSGNCVSCASGGRVDFGGGANDYCSSDGTTVSCMAGALTMTLTTVSAAATLATDNNGVVNSVANAPLRLTDAHSTRWDGVAVASLPTCPGTGNAAQTGALQYTTDTNYMAFCDGTRWTRLTRSLQATSVVDFGAQTTACEDSSGITVTGAAFGDACKVGTSTAWEAGATYMCFVSAADTVVVRFCSVGVLVNPASRTYTVHVSK